MPGQDDNKEKGISSRSQEGQGGSGSQNTSQNKSNANTEQDGNRADARSKGSEKSVDGENLRAANEAMDTEKEMD